MSEFLRAMILPVGMFFIMYLFLIRPQKKQEEKKREMIASLVEGDEIITIGGIHGKIVVAKEDLLTIETSTTKSRIEISRWAVGTKKE